MFVCTVCGYIYDGEEAPENCPKCGAPKEKFDAIADADAEKIERSRFTNGLHAQLLGLLEEISFIAADGIEDALDPGCVDIFKNAMKLSDEISRSVRAELQGHMKKGKWG